MLITRMQVAVLTEILDTPECPAWKIGLQMTDIILLPFPEIVVQEKIRFVFLHLFIKLLPRARGANEIKGRFLCVVLAPRCLATPQQRGDSANATTQS